MAPSEPAIDRHPPLQCTQESPGVFFSPLNKKYFDKPTIKALEATLDKAGFVVIAEPHRRLNEKKQYGTPGVWILAKQKDGSARDALKKYARARFDADIDYHWHDGPTMFVPDEPTYKSITGGSRSRLMRMNQIVFGSPSRNSSSTRLKIRLQKDRGRLWSPLTVRGGQGTLTGDIHPLGGSGLMAIVTVPNGHLKK